MRRFGSFGFWILAALGGALWLYDVVDRLRHAEDPKRVWMVLLASVASGAGLELLFLLARQGVIRAMASRLYAARPEERAALADLSASRFGNWTGAILFATMIVLAVGAFVFDWFDPLTPIAFFVGFLIVWWSVGGHRYSPPEIGSGEKGPA